MYDAYLHHQSDMRGIAKDYVRSGQFGFDCVTSIPIGWLEHSQRVRLCIGHEFKDPEMDVFLIPPDPGQETGE